MSCGSSYQALALGQIYLGICLSDQLLLDFLLCCWLSDLLQMNWDA